MLYPIGPMSPIRSFPQTRLATLSSISPRSPRRYAYTPRRFLPQLLVQQPQHPEQ